jgi:hypothetical protein
MCVWWYLSGEERRRRGPKIILFHHTKYNAAAAEGENFVANFRNILSYFISHHWKRFIFFLSLSQPHNSNNNNNSSSNDDSCMKGQKKDIHKMRVLYLNLFRCAPVPLMLMRKRIA